MPDNLPNPDASAVITPPAGPPAPQTQSPDMGEQPVQSFNPPARGVPAAQPQQPAQGIPTQQTPPPQQPAPQSGWHKAFQSLMGSSTQYQQTPNGPVPVQVQNKPGQLFRSILAGAIMGGAAGQEAHNQNPYGGFVGGFMPGAKAGMQNQQAEAQKAQSQAQQQWQNQLTANKDKREESAADQEKIKTNAQVGLWNIQKLAALNEIHGKSYTEHLGYVKDADPIVQGYKMNGNDPIRQNVSEQDHLTWLNDPMHKGDSTLDWEPVGVTPYVTKNPDGTESVDYQTVWNAYSKTKNMPVTPSLLDRWKKSGLTEKYPPGGLERSLKVDPITGQKSLPYDAFVSLNTQNLGLEAQKRQQQADDFTTKKEKADLAHVAAQIQQEHAAAAASGNEAALRAFELKQEKSGVDAQTSLAKSGGDWTKLTPNQKVALQPQVQKDIDEARRGLSDPLLKEQLQSMDPDVKKVATDRAKQLWEQLDDAKKHSIFVPPSKDRGGIDGIPAGAQVAINPQTGEKRYSIDGGKTWLSLAASPSPNALPPGIPPIPATYKGTRQNWIAAHTNQPNPPEGPASSLSGGGSNTPGTSWGKQ